MSLDIDAMRRAVEDQTRKWTSSKERASAFLVRLGTHNPDGSLTAEYGGERTAPLEERRKFVAPYGLTIAD